MRLPLVFLHEDYTREIFEIHLMHDAGVGRDDGEVAETGLTPAKKRVTLFVALKFEKSIHIESVGGAEFIDLDGVVDDQFYRLQRIDKSRIAAQGLHGVAHGGQVDYAGDAGEILEKHAAGCEGDFFVGLRFAVPIRQRREFLLW